MTGNVGECSMFGGVLWRLGIIWSNFAGVPSKTGRSPTVGDRRNQRFASGSSTSTVIDHEISLSWWCFWVVSLEECSLSPILDGFESEEITDMSLIKPSNPALRLVTFPRAASRCSLRHVQFDGSLPPRWSGGFPLLASQAWCLGPPEDRLSNDFESASSSELSGYNVCVCNCVYINTIYYIHIYYNHSMDHSEERIFTHSTDMYGP